MFQFSDFAKHLRNFGCSGLLALRNHSGSTMDVDYSTGKESTDWSVHPFVSLAVVRRSSRTDPSSWSLAGHVAGWLADCKSAGVRVLSVYFQWALCSNGLCR